MACSGWPYFKNSPYANYSEIAAQQMASTSGQRENDMMGNYGDSFGGSPKYQQQIDNVAINEQDRFLPIGKSYTFFCEAFKRNIQFV